MSAARRRSAALPQRARASSDTRERVHQHARRCNIRHGTVGINATAAQRQHTLGSYTLVQNSMLHASMSRALPSLAS